MIKKKSEKPVPPRSLQAVLERGRSFLAERGVEPSRLLAERLLEGMLACKKYELVLNANRVLAARDVRTYFSFLKKRAENIPSQYILGRMDFMDFELEVNPSVLIPRVETEFLVEKTLEECRRRGWSARRIGILDMGTGSGNIAISLAGYLSKAEVWAADISERALNVARKNARLNEVTHRIRFVASDLFAAVPSKQKFDIIISNPPYLSYRDLEEVPPEVLKEPRTALCGGEEGTEILSRLLRDSRDYLKENGLVFFEIGAFQGKKVADILKQEGWAGFRIFKDYCGWERVVVASRRLRDFGKG